MIQQESLIIIRSYLWLLKLAMKMTLSHLLSSIVFVCRVLLCYPLILKLRGKYLALIVRDPPHHHPTQITLHRNFCDSDWKLSEPVEMWLEWLKKWGGFWFRCNFRQRTWSNCTYSVTVISVSSVLSRQRSSRKLIFNSVVYFSNDTRLWDWKESDRVLILSWLSSDLRLETPWVSNLFSSRINTSLKRKMSSSEEVYPRFLYKIRCDSVVFRSPGSLGSVDSGEMSFSARLTRITSRTSSTWPGWTSRSRTTDRHWTWSSTSSLMTS